MQGTRASWTFDSPGTLRTDGLWRLRRASALMLPAPWNRFLRTADAIHLATACEAGERDVWTHDRHMLAAAADFGLTGRTI